MSSIIFLEDHYNETVGPVAHRDEIKKRREIAAKYAEQNREKIWGMLSPTFGEFEGIRVNNDPISSYSKHGPCPNTKLFGFNVRYENVTGNKLRQDFGVGISHLKDPCLGRDHTEEPHLVIKFTMGPTTLPDLMIEESRANTLIDRVIIRQLKSEYDKFMRLSEGKGPEFYTELYVFNVTIKVPEALLEENGVLASRLFNCEFTTDPDRVNNHRTKNPIKENLNGAVDEVEREFTGKKYNNFVCYINDPDNEISNLYTNMCGKAVQVVKHSEKDSPTGLFIFKRERNGSAKDYHYSLAQLKDDKEIAELGMFRSESDALTGNNVAYVNNLKKVLREKEVALEKLTKQIEELEIKNTHLSNANALIKEQSKAKDAQNKILLAQAKQTDKFSTAGGFLGLIERAFGFFTRTLFPFLA